MSRPSDLTDRIVALLPRLRRFALTLTRHQEDGDDLVQTTVERALLRLSSWKEGTRLDSWMFKIMQNAWIDQTRSRRSKGVEVPEFDFAGHAGDDGRALVDARSALRATLVAAMRLPEDQRAVIALVVVEGLAYREAAEVLDVPVGTIMSRLSRARLALEGQVFGEGPAPMSQVRH